MSGKRLWLGKWKILQVMAVLAVLVGSIVWARSTQAVAPATPGSGVTAAMVANGALLEPVNVKMKIDKGLGGVVNHSNTTIDVTRIQTWIVTIAPGGTTGWHMHPGPHLIVVAQGALTYYRGDDSTCTGIQYPAGTTVFDPGFTVHLVRNNGTVPVVNYVTQLLSADMLPFRMDVPAPGNPDCPLSLQGWPTP
jgi:quercetin dioxygenase-like cupin family protein